MGTGIFFPALAIPFSAIIVALYFIKGHINSKETWIFGTLIVSNFFGLIIEIFCTYASYIYETNRILSIFIYKLYLLYIILWISTFAYYVYSMVRSENAIKKTRIPIFLGYYFIISIILTILPIEAIISDDFTIRYTKGLSVTFTYLISAIAISVIIIMLIINLKKIKDKKYIPVFLFLIFGMIISSIQMIYPQILLMTYLETFICVIMYFTIENPDMKMVEELTLNRKLTEQNFEEKSNFLFKISQDLKQPLKEMTDLSQEIINKNNIEENAKEINLNSRQLYTYVNDALDVSQIDIKNLKIIDSVYNSKNFFEEINKRVETEIKNQKKDIEYRHNITKNLPEYLLGDNTKIKQMILSILFNSIKHTKKGFVELNVNSIIKYGICRLIIDISDSGGGISIDKINNVLSSTGELSKKELEKIDTLNIDLPLVHKMIKVLNGNFIIKSEKNLGTHFSIIIDQKIENKKIITKEYSKENNKILLISENESIFNTLNKISDEIDIEQSFYLRDALEKLEEKEIRCILIDDKLKEMNALSILRNLNTEIPSIIIISEKEEFLGKHYIDDGFKNYIIKEKIEEEIEKIKEYL